MTKYLNDDSLKKRLGVSTEGMHLLSTRVKFNVIQVLNAIIKKVKGRKKWIRLNDESSFSPFKARNDFFN